MCGRMLSKERKTKDLINEMIPLPRNFFSKLTTFAVTWKARHFHDFLQAFIFIDIKLWDIFFCKKQMKMRIIRKNHKVYGFYAIDVGYKIIIWLAPITHISS